MDHIAIDLGGRESQVCVRSHSGQIVHEDRMRTEALGRWLGRRAPGRVIMETCSESFVVAEHAQAAGHQVRVVPATLVRTLGVGARRTKTDRRDAQVLSEVSTRVDLPSVHLRSASSRTLQSMCSARQALVRCRTQLINAVRGWARCQGLRLSSGGPCTFGSRVHKQTQTLPAHIEQLLGAIESLNAQIGCADQALKTLVKDHELCQRLMSVPGVGVITALWFVCTVDEVTRFSDSHSLQAYLGLVPGERSSSDKKRRTGLTKAGNANVRWTLIQAAWTAWRGRPQDPMVQWAKRVAQRRGNQVAIAALARKMAGILYAIWRDGSRYDPCRGAERIDADGVVHPARR